MSIKQSSIEIYEMRHVEQGINKDLVYFIRFLITELMNILPEVGQVMEFDIMSIIFLVIILISIIVGAFRGFIGSIVSFISSFGSMFFASLFSEQLGNLIYSTEF